MPVPPLIATEAVGPTDHIVGQALDGSQLNPTDENLSRAGFAVLAVGAVGLLLAVRSPKFALGIMTGTLGVSMLAAYVALSRPSDATWWPTQ